MQIKEVYSGIRRTCIYFLFIMVLFSRSCIMIEPEDIDNGKTKISDNAIIFTESEWENAIKSIDEKSYTFTFTGDQDFKIGEIIVSEADDGYLRKITNIQRSENDVIVSTSQAILTDVIERSDTSFTIELTADQI